MKDEAPSTSLYVAILFGAIAAAGFVLDHLHDEVGGGKNWATLGRIAFYTGSACAAAAWWVHKRYPEWSASGLRPGGLPIRNAESLRQPLWLLVASMIAPVPALGSLIFGAGAALLLVAGIPRGQADPAKVLVGILAVAATSIYVLAVVTKRQHANEATVVDLLRTACALTALGLTTQLYLPYAIGADANAPSGAAAWTCLAAVLATALMAFSASHDYAPKDAMGKSETPRWTYRSKRKHA